MDYEAQAALYAEEYGILDYTVKGNIMTYYANYPAYLSELRRTYKVEVNLNTLGESRTLLSRWSKKGNANIHK